MQDEELMQRAIEQRKTHHTNGQTARGAEAPRAPVAESPRKQRWQLLAGLATGVDQRKASVRELLTSFRRQRSRQAAELKSQRLATLARIQGEAVLARSATQEDLMGARDAWRSQAVSPDPLAAATSAQPPAASSPRPARRRYYEPPSKLTAAPAAPPQRDASHGRPAAPPLVAPAPPPPAGGRDAGPVAGLETVSAPVPPETRTADVESRLAVLEDGLTRVIDRLTEEPAPHPAVQQLEGRFGAVESQLAVIETQLAQTAAALQQVVALQRERAGKDDPEDPRLGSLSELVQALDRRLGPVEQAMEQLLQQLNDRLASPESWTQLTSRLAEVESNLASLEAAVVRPAELVSTPAAAPLREQARTARGSGAPETDAAPAAADRQSAAKVLASLSKLVEGLKSSAERPGQGASRHE